MNRVILLGPLVHDPQLRYAPDGMPVAELLVVVDGAVSMTSGVSCVAPCEVEVVCWHPLAEDVAARLRRGDAALIEGRLHRPTPIGRHRRPRRLQVVAATITPLHDRCPDAAAPEGSFEVPPLDRPPEPF